MVDEIKNRADAIRIRLVGDVKEVWQDGKRTAFIVDGTRVPLELIADYRENSLYLIPECQVWTHYETLQIFLVREARIIRHVELELSSVREHGPVEILRS